MNELRRIFDARLASLAVIVFVVLAAVIVCLDTLGWWREETTALADLQRRTALLETRAAGFANRDSDAAADAADGRVLVHGDTPGLVMAELQRIVTFSSEKAGAVVRAVDTPEGQTVPDARDAEGNALRRVRLAAEIEVMEQALPDLLYAIETDFPVMIVDGFTLRGNRRIESVGGESWSASVDRPLSLRLAISAFRTEDAP